MTHEEIAAQDRARDEEPAAQDHAQVDDVASPNRGAEAENGRKG